eukprot:3366743-Prymnesium_polylepis.1
MKLIELTLLLLLSWHYMGCFWWYVGEAYERSTAERMHLLGTLSLTNSSMNEYDDDASLSL